MSTTKINVIDTTEQRAKIYSYVYNGKKKTVKREWVNIGMKKAMKRELEEYLNDKIKKYQQVYRLRNIVYFHKKYNEQADFSCSYSMFYKYYRQLIH